jgi:metal transporter CNNM
MMAATIRATGTVGRTSYNGYTASRPAVFGLAKILCLGISQLSFAGAAPLTSFLYTHEEEPDPEDASLWLYLTIAMVLVLLGGAFAGLTIA